MAYLSECRAAGIGAGIFIAIQLALVPFSVGGVGWFLNSGTTIVITLAVLAAAAIVIELVDRPFLPWRPIWMTAGVWTAMMVYLFAIGPGNLFPIVIVMASFMLIPTVVVAGYVGMMVRLYLRGD
jgi:hypothetical protein